MISIIVPCYNAENTINQTIDRLCRQGSICNFEIILIDDGSTDSTPGICDRRADLDSRIRVFHQQNCGLMGAWKRGVREASGEYIAFCDADDWLDIDFVERITGIIDSYHPNIILFGMVTEYSDDKRVTAYNRLQEGYYDENAIKNNILPNILSDGSMQSEMIFASRWSKVFNKSVLTTVMNDLNEEVSIGEDLLTTFSTMQVAKSLFCMGDYCPYHYNRHSDSMIGRFDRKIFDKINILFREMDHIAKIHSYPYPDQLIFERMSVTLLNIKKYICRSTEGYRSTMKVIRDVRDSVEVKDCIEKCNVKGYNLSTRLFARLFIYRLYYPLYFGLRVIECLRGRDI